MTWLDITGHGGWHEPSDVEEMAPASMVTVGWILEESGDTIKMCSSREVSGELVGDVTVIPRCVVESVEVMDS